MTLRITVLGSSGSYASYENPCSGYLVQCDDPVPTSVWVDCGPGTLANLQKHIDLEDLDAIVASHVHPDHFVELPIFANTCRWFLERGSIVVATTAEVAAATVELAPAAKEVFKTSIISAATDFEIGGLRFSFSQTDHPVETLAMRIEGDGRSLGYTSDTGPGWHPRELGAGLDLLIAEASMHGTVHTGARHLLSSEAGSMAKEAGAGRLAITHIPPTCSVEVHVNQAAEAFGATVEYCAVGKVFEV